MFSLELNYKVMSFKICSVLLLFPIFSFPQASINSIKDARLSGTLVILAVADDGMIIAADSRCDFGPDPDKPLAYFDGIEKIVKIKNYGVAIVGLSSTRSADMAEEIKKYEYAIPDSTGLNDLVIGFYKYLFADISRSDFLAFGKTRLLFAGYDKGTPNIIAAQVNDNGTGLTTHLRTDSLVSDNHASKYFRYVPHSNCNYLSKMAEKAIYKYASAANLKNNIGGPVSVLKISRSREPVFLQNDFTNYISTLKDFLKRYKEGHIKMHYLQPNAKESIDSLIRTDYTTK